MNVNARKETRENTSSLPTGNVMINEYFIQLHKINVQIFSKIDCFFKNYCLK